jgi:hypothetical protein
MAFFRRLFIADEWQSGHDQLDKLQWHGEHRRRDPKCDDHTAVGEIILSAVSSVSDLILAGFIFKPAWVARRFFAMPGGGLRWEQERARA